jgi:hypothetical protein
VMSATTISAGYRSERRCFWGDAGALRDPDTRLGVVLEPGILSLIST